jgi:hypothetical protein
MGKGNIQPRILNLGLTPEVRGQHHTLNVLCLGKETPVPITLEAVSPTAILHNV